MPRVQHFEISADDPEKVAAFYEKVFGWKITKWEGPVEYWLASTGEKVSAALLAMAIQDVGGKAVSLVGHQIRLSTDEEGARLALLEAAQGSGMAGIEVKPVAEQSGLSAAVLERVARVLAREHTLERVGEGLLVHRDHAEALKREVRARWPPGTRLDVAAIKEMTGLSRKYVIPLLEYLDREKVTRRSGKDRVVLG